MRPVSGVSASSAWPPPRATTLPSRLRRLAAGIDLHPPAAGCVEPAERQVDQAFVRFGRAFDDGEIGLADLALLEQEPQPLQRLVVASEDEAAGGVAIEPMREGRIARQAEAKMMERGLEIFAALRPLVHRDAGRLVEDEDQRVAIEQPRVDLGFREKFWRFGEAHHQPRRLNQMIGMRALSRMRPRPHS